MTPATATPGRGVRAVARAFDLYERAFASGPAAGRLSRPRPVRRSGYETRLLVAAREVVADGVVSLRLSHPQGRALPSWTPGAHLDLLLPSGRMRQYSLCGDPADRSSYRIAVRLVEDGFGGSREVHEQLRPGGCLRVRGPRNGFRLLAAPAYVFLAGGIGITPILPMVQAAARTGAPWRLCYLGRSRATMPFREELAAFGGGELIEHHDDEAGHADLAALLDRSAALANRPDVYACGPPPVMDTVRELMRTADASIPVFAERFSPPVVIDGRPFVAELARSGRAVPVAANESLLAAIRRELPGVVYSCQQGFCRACRCRVLDGAVEHRDPGTLLEAERSDSMLVCVSRAAGDRLVLDL